MRQHLPCLNRVVSAVALLLFTALPLPILAAAPVVAHSLMVTLDPAAGTVQVEDTLRLPAAETAWEFVLHSGLNPQLVAGDATLTATGTVAHLTSYRLTRQSAGAVTLRYGGRIRHEHINTAENLGRSQQWSVGTIAPEGVFLDGNSGWYPRHPTMLHTFTLQAQVPPGWTAVSQGADSGATDAGLITWTETHPQEDIYLLAAPFTVYRQQAAGFEAQVYLRQPDAALAQRYLDATGKYVAHYADLIGTYPFAKFALVENFWETGYGMPSLTLLGGQVLRLPFIIDSSYPHEILHNWWGNGVYIAATEGNWSEGLTTDLADHWLQIQAGRGAEYRRDMLKAFADGVRETADVPLAAFRARHNSASQAIGYGKGAFFFHMLRQQLGEATFTQGLRRFYADNRFQAAGFTELQRAFAAVSGRDLSDFFTAWTTRPGAPRLALRDVQMTANGDGYQVSGQIAQIQAAAPFPVQIPLVITPITGAPLRVNISSSERLTPFAIPLPVKPRSLDVDPEFDVFRELEAGETPVTLGALFGAERGLLVLPAAASAPELAAYQQLATRWQAGHPGWQIRLDRELAQVPDDQPVWLFGWDNRHQTALTSGATAFTVDAATRQVHIGATVLDGASASIVLTGQRGQQPLAWLVTSDVAALPALTRKLPHYGKYSSLRFEGAAALIRHKEQWPMTASALRHRF
ncbi:peptidase M28 [Chromatium okenii]|nr:peptidase M28 [Chromatium okenii]